MIDAALNVLTFVDGAWGVQLINSTKSIMLAREFAGSTRARSSTSSGDARRPLIKEKKKKKKKKKRKQKNNNRKKNLHSGAIQLVSPTAVRSLILNPRRTLRILFTWQFDSHPRFFLAGQLTLAVVRARADTRRSSAYRFRAASCLDIVRSR